MNDFTKEELEEIYDALDICYFGEYPFLGGKIRLMIDSYCEHKYEGCCEACAIEECIYCKKVKWSI